MSYKLSDIKYETEKHFVLDVGDKGFEVYRIGITHSTRCAIIGFKGEDGLKRSIDEVARRESDK